MRNISERICTESRNRCFMFKKYYFPKSIWYS